MSWEDDPRTTEELFHASLEGDYDDEAAWQAVCVLRWRGTEEVFLLARQYTKSAVPLERARGLGVLAQLGAGPPPQRERPHFGESVAIAIEHLRDPDHRVASSAAWALAHLGGEAAISALIPMRKDSNPDVRWAVANGLFGSERPDAVETIIELMDDADDNVRDWATFALGSQSKADSAYIRDALRKRLSDTYEDARAEAIWGLAQRKDKQGIQLLIDQLEDPEHGRGCEMAAAEALALPSDTPTEELCNGLRKLLPDYLPR